MECSLEITTIAEPAGIRLRGTLGASTLSLFDLAVDLLLEHDGDVVLDLGGVTFVDSDGLRALIRTAASVEARGRRLVVENPRPQLFRLAESLGFGLPAVHEAGIARSRDMPMWSWPSRP